MLELLVFERGALKEGPQPYDELAHCVLERDVFRHAPSRQVEQRRREAAAAEAAPCDSPAQLG